MPRRHQIADTLGIQLPATLSADQRLWRAVVMSRLGRNPLARRVELATLQRWTEEAIQRGEAPLAVVGTSSYRWVLRACELLGTAAVQLALADDPASSRLATASDAHERCGQGTYAIAAPGCSRDALAILLADRVDVALVRRSGTIHRLLLERLAEDRSAAVRVLIPIRAWGQTMGQATATASACVAEELIAQGAVGYCCRWDTEPRCDAELARPGQSAAASLDPPGSAEPRRVDRMASAVEPEGASETTFGGGAAIGSATLSLLEQPQRWLIHWTRGRQGAWPGQSEQQFFDWLLLTRPQRADLSPLATLQRIVQQRQLVGTSRTVPGDQAVVCFSALSLLEVASRRVYRPHLGRWDAEPYGLAIDIDAAKELGAQEVVYTPPQRKRQAPPEPTWRFQAHGRTFDWTAEQEWRLPGVADLRGLGPAQAVVFVAREAEARTWTGSPWPVVSVETLQRIASEGVANYQRLG